MPAFDFVLAGRYRLVAPLGEGGMAAVYRARDLRLGREVAVKVLHDDLTRDEAFLSRFEREAQVVAGLAHASIVPVYDVGDDHGSRYIVMEYVRGRTLKEALELRGTVDPAEAAALLIPILEALGYAHKQGLIHRDVKPQNILIAADGTPRLADFGIAHLVDGSSTRTAAILGSAHYLSPEQSRGEQATERSDIYACGIVLYEMLAGNPPFDGPNALAIANQHLQASPPPLPGGRHRHHAALHAILDQALAKDPAARFRDTSSFAAALAPLVVSHHDRDSTTVQPIDRTAVVPLGGTTVQPLVQDETAGQISRGAHAVASPRAAEITLRRSPRKTYLAAAGLAAILAVLAYAGTFTVAGYALPGYPSTPYAAVPAVCLLVLALSWLNCRSWLYTMDESAAVVRWGLFGHHRYGVPVRNITTLELRQNVLERILGVGRVELTARDQHGKERRVIMEDLPRPRQTYDDLVRQLGRSGRRAAQ